MDAYVYLRVAPGKVGAVLTQLAGRQGLRRAVAVIGDWDVLIQVEGPDLEQIAGFFVNILPIRVNNNLGILRRFVGCVNAGEFADLASPRFFIEMLGIARFANCQRRINEHFNKFGVTFQRDLARATAIHPIRRDECSDDDCPSVRHELGHFAYTANVFDPVVWRKPKV